MTSNMKNFSGRRMSAFLMLADCQQFKLAADRFNVSQSAFSQMIAQLETEMNTRLFDRGTRHVALTPEGELLLPMARRLAQNIDSMFASLKDHAEHKQGKVSLAAMASLTAEWLPRVISEFKETYPGIKVHLFDTRFDHSMQLLREGVLDFALKPQINYSDEFETSLLFEEPFYLVCSSEHPLAHRKKLQLKDLAGCELLASSKTGGVWRQLSPLLSNIETIDTGFEVEHLSTLAGLVANRLGVAIVPGFSLYQFYRQGLHAIPILEKGLKRQVLIVTRRGHSMSATASTFLDLLRSTTVNLAPLEMIHINKT